MAAFCCFYLLSLFHLSSAEVTTATPTDRRNAAPTLIVNNFDSGMESIVGPQKVAEVIETFLKKYTTRSRVSVFIDKKQRDDKEALYSANLKNIFSDTKSLKFSTIDAEGCILVSLLGKLPSNSHSLSVGQAEVRSVDRATADAYSNHGVTFVDVSHVENPGSFARDLLLGGELPWLAVFVPEVPKGDEIFSLLQTSQFLTEDSRAPRRELQALPEAMELITPGILSQVLIIIFLFIVVMIGACCLIDVDVPKIYEEKVLTMNKEF